MPNQLFYIQFNNADGKLTAITHDNKIGQPNWYLVAVNKSHLSDFETNYKNYQYDRNSGALVYPDAKPTNLLPNINITGGVSSLGATKADKSSLNAVATSANTDYTKESEARVALAGSAHSDASSASAAIKAVAGDPTSLTSLSNFISANSGNIDALGTMAGSLHSVAANKADKSSLSAVSQSVSTNAAGIATNKGAITSLDTNLHNNFATQADLKSTDNSLAPSLANSALSAANTNASSYTNQQVSSVNNNIAQNSATQDAYFNQAEKDNNDSYATLQSEVNELHSELSDVLNR